MEPLGPGLGTPCLKPSMKSVVSPATPITPGLASKPPFCSTLVLRIPCSTEVQQTAQHHASRHEAVTAVWGGALVPLESDSVADLMTGSLPLAPAARPHDTLPSMTGSHERARVHTHTKTHTHTTHTHTHTIARQSIRCLYRRTGSRQQARHAAHRTNNTHTTGSRQ